MHTIDNDIIGNLQLLRDDNDPPRYYLQQRHRRELIAIGDESLARSRFAIWRNRSRLNLNPINHLTTVPSDRLPAAPPAIRSEFGLSA